MHSSLVEEAKAALGKYFDPQDYPTASQVKDKFKFTYVFTEIELPEKVQEELKEQMMQQWQDVKEMATAVLKQELVELCQKLRKAYDVGTGKRTVLRESTWTRFLEFLSLFEHRNLADNQELKEIVEKLKNSYQDVDYSIARTEAFRERLRHELEPIIQQFNLNVSGVRAIQMEEKPEQQVKSEEMEEEEDVDEEVDTDTEEPEISEVPVNEEEVTEEDEIS